MSSDEIPDTGPGVTLEVARLTKRFGSLTAVDDLTFSVAPGRITGFLGPNGAGKTTTLRMLLGLVRPTSGTALIGGRRYADLPDPLRTVGAALEATNFHPGRTGRDHLRVLAAAARIGDERVDELLGFVGLGEAARKRTSQYSSGMRQRLGLAAALLGDPHVLVLDEPTNGLDPEGIRWLRGFLRGLAGEGRTVLISSHLLGEVQQTVDDVVIITHGRLVHAGPIGSLGAGGGGARVRTSDPARLAGALRVADVLAEIHGEGEDATITTDSGDLRLIGDVAHRAGLPIWELTATKADLETLFLELTDDDSGAEPDGRGAPVVPAVGEESTPAPPEVPEPGPDHLPEQAGEK